MAFSDKKADIINREIYIDDESYEQDISLIDYINKTCKEKCNIEWSINTPQNANA